MVKNARSLFVLLMLAGAATMFVSIDSYAAQDPNKEQDDGCDHGATGKECRDDPSEKGKDCVEHGKQGGINEDHCVSTTTTVPEVTVTTDDVTVTTLPGTTATTTAEPGAEIPTEPEAPRGTPTTPVDEPLPITGGPSAALAGLAAGMILSGTGLRWFSR